jgi:hypothetical protein
METVYETSVITPRHRPWNKGKLIGRKPPLQRAPCARAVSGHDATWPTLAQMTGDVQEADSHAP